MNKKTNENVNCTNLEDNTTIDNSIENAFSDLISQYFEEGNNIQNAGNIKQGPTLDWDSVANGQLYTNLAGNINIEPQTQNANNIQNGIYNVNLGNVVGNNIDGVNLNTNNNGNLYTNLQNGGEQVNNGETTNVEQAGNTQNILYNNLANVNVEGTTGNAEVGLDQSVNSENATTGGADFKLTQGNLPAKIGFWTKVRNFFRPEAKISYSLQEQTQENKGLWNQLQNFFSFGKSGK